MVLIHMLNFHLLKVFFSRVTRLPSLIESRVNCNYERYFTKKYNFVIMVLLMVG